MRRLLVAVAFILLAALPAQGQAGNAVALSGIGAPSGACATGLMFYTNVTNSDFYNCPNGAWNKVTGSGSTGSSSSGQALVNSGGSIVGKDIEGTGSALLACTDTSLATGDIWTWDGAKCINTAVGIAINAQTGTTYTVQAGDKGKLVTLSNGSAIAVTLPQATGSFVAPWYTYACARGAGTATITPTTSTINGAATLALTTNMCATIVSDSTNYVAIVTNPTGGGGTAGFSYLMDTTQLTPADGQQYYFGGTSWQTVAPATPSNFVKIPIPVTGTITEFRLYVIVGTPGTNEAVTIALMKNGVDTAISGTMTWDAATPNEFTVTGASVAISNGDYITIHVTSPTWVTNPVGVRLQTFSIRVTGAS